MAILCLLSVRLPAAELMTPAVPLTPDCKYLIIVDTSLSMSRMAETTARSLHQMVSSGLYGQMKEGEVFTIWTFNESIQQREFPLNAWKPELKQSLGNRVLQFMASQRYRRSQNMHALMNALTRARGICPNLAVLLVTDGSQAIVGTPFDRTINNAYGWRADELKAAKVPFLTVLMSEKGKFVGSTVHAANEPLELPLGPGGRRIVGKSRSAQKPVPAPVIPQAPRPITTATLTPKRNTNSMRIVQTLPRPPAQTNTPPATQRTNFPASTPRTVAQPVKRIEPPPATNVAKITPTPKTNTVSRMNAPPRPRVDRKVIELAPKPEPKPKVVNATDIQPRAKRTLPVRRKEPEYNKNNPSNRVAGATNTISTNVIAAASNPPATDKIAKATAPTPASNTNAPPVAPIPSTTIAAPKPTNLVSTPNPASVVRTAFSAPPSTNASQPIQIQIITQIVNVPVPQVVVEKTEPKPTAVANATTNTPAAKRVQTPAPAPATATIPQANAQPIVVANDPPPPASEPVQVAALTKKSQNPAHTPSAPAEASPESTPKSRAPVSRPSTTPSSAALAVASEPRLPNWFYLGVALSVLGIAIYCSRKLVQRPGDPSLISQSMEER